MSDSTKRLRWVDSVGIGVVVLLTGAVYFGGLRPILAQVGQRAAQRQELAAQQQQAASLSAALNQTRAELAAAEQALAKAPLRLQPMDALNSRVAQITNLATSQGLRIEAVRPGRRSAGPHYQTVPLTVTGAGSFEASTAYLHQLHATLPDVAVTAFELTAQPGRPGAAPQPTFSLNLIWYAAEEVSSSGLKKGKTAPIH